MNKCIFVGNLTNYPEVRYTSNGKAVASFVIAVNQKNTNAEFINIVAWDKLAEICGNNLDKGRKILVEGKLQNRSYEDKNGIKRYITEIIAQNIEFLDYKKDSTKNAADFGVACNDNQEIEF